MSINYDRFNIDNLLRLSPKKEGLLQDSFIEAVEEKYKAKIDTAFADPEKRRILINKSLAHLFLDKTENMLGSWHPDTHYVASWGYNTSTFSSMEMVRYLNLIRNDPRLTDETKDIIDRWIVKESGYLPMAIIMDGWRAENNQAVAGVLSQSKDNLRSITFDPPQEEVQDLADAIAIQFSKLPSHDTLKLLGGSSMHETRLLFQKSDDDTVFAYHYNTGLGGTKAEGVSQITAYGPIPLWVVKDPETWIDFIYCKMGNSSMHSMNQFLEMRFGKGQPLEDMPGKSMQLTDSCPVQVGEAEFKHLMLAESESIEKGMEQYKLCKSLMASAALKTEKKEVDPTLYRLLQFKEKYRHRYVEWWDLSQDSEKFQEAKKGYLALIDFIKPNIEEKLRKIIEGHSTWVQLKTLDDALKRLLPNLKREQLGELEALHKKLFPSQNTPIIVLRYRESLDLVMSSILETQKKIQSVSRQMLQEHGKELLRPDVYHIASQFLKSNSIDPANLKKLLHLYFKQEAPETVLPVLKDFITMRLLDFSAIDQALHGLIQEGDQDKVKKLVHLMGTMQEELPTDWQIYIAVIEGNEERLRILLKTSLDDFSPIKYGISLSKQIYTSEEFAIIVDKGIHAGLPKDGLILAMENFDADKGKKLFTDLLQTKLLTAAKTAKILKDGFFKEFYVNTIISSSRDDRVDILYLAIEPINKTPDKLHIFRKWIQKSIINIANSDNFANISKLSLQLSEKRVIGVHELNQICLEQMSKGQFEDLMPLVQEIGKNSKELSLADQYLYAILNMDLSRAKELKANPKFKIERVFKKILDAVRALRSKEEYSQIIPLLR